VAKPSNTEKLVALHAACVRKHDWGAARRLERRIRRAERAQRQQLGLQQG